MRPLVSVVVPNHNGAEFLRECIESVLNQSYKNLEIIVVDDHSSDNSIEILDSYKKKINLIICHEYGAGAARNAGILHSTGEFIALLDSDDIWEENKIKLQIDLLEKSNAGLVYCHSMEFTDNGSEIKKHFGIFKGDCYKFFIKNPGVAIVELGCSTAIFRRKILLMSGNFDPKFLGAAEDWDFFRRICRFTTIDYVDQVLMRYRRHGNNISSRGILDFKKGNERAVRKLIADDPNIGKIQARFCWVKLQLMIFKTCIKEKQLKLAVSSMIEGIFGKI